MKKRAMIFRFKGGQFDFEAKPLCIFGILNVTPDSFSDGGRFFLQEKALAQALALERDGADVIDIGGESTRPGAESVSATDEVARVVPLIRDLASKLRIPISIDTTKSAVAQASLEAGAVIVNDISGFTADPAMAGIVKSARAGAILMHRRGTPATMQSLCQYTDLISEVRTELLTRYQFARAAGLEEESLALDPGIGFAKTPAQNQLLLRELHLLTLEGALSYRPWMVGLSRKSFLGGDLSQRGPATLAAELAAVDAGARIIRTHDVGALGRAMELRS